MRTARAIGAFVRRDFRTALTYRLSLVSTLLASVFTLISFKFIAKLVHGGAFAGSTVAYFRYVVVGLALGGVLDAGMGRPASAARSDQVQGTLELLTTQPLSPMGLGLGWAAFPLLEAMVTSLLILLIATPLGFRADQPNVGVALLTLALSAVVFGALGMLTAAIVLAVQQAVQVTHFATAVLSLLSGVLFPIALLPGWLQVVSYLSPMTYAVDAMRGALLHHSTLFGVGTDLLILVGFAVVLLPLGAHAIRVALAYARRRGTLSSF